MKKIVVLAGGDGSERAVSIASGRRVAEAFCRLGVKVALIDPVSEADPLHEHFYTDFEELKRASSLFSAYGVGAIKNKSDFNKGGGGVFSADKNGNKDTLSKAFAGVRSARGITESALKVCQSADAVFIMLHGGIGENGRLQALFECLGIKYFGSSPEGSAAAMDKILAKRIFESALIPTPSYTVYKKGQPSPPLPPKYPCVVKPASEGSSVGVTLVKEPRELEKAVSVAQGSCEKVLMESWIKGREITVGILGDKALAVTEIIPKSGFYDYESKYIEGKTLEVTPADISDILTKKALCLAERAHKALGLSDFSRVDMMIEVKTDQIYVLEVNTVPGMTKTSLLPLAAEYRGIDFTELCKRMAHL